MTKADLGSIVTKEVLESEKNSKKDSEKEMKEALLKKRIHRFTCIITTIIAGFVCFLSAERYFCWMVQTVIDRTDVHISEIPFPAITLCPVMNVYTLIKPLHKNDETIVSQFLHSLEEAVPSDDDTTDFNDQSLTAMEYIIDDRNILNKVSFQCEDFFAECTWRRIKRNCCNLFRIAPIGEKICYAFNSLSVENPESTWPWSETLSGRGSGLRVVMKTNASQAMTPKVMAMIHYPEEPISSNTLYLQGEVHITLDALKFYADTTIRQLPAEYRRCYFTDEINKYNKSPCQCYKDCRIAYMEDVCNCTPQGLLPKSKSNKQHCNTTHLPCILKHRGVLFSNGNIYEKNIDENTMEFMDCKCFPNCNYVQYKTFIRYDLETSTKIGDNSLVDLEVHFLRDTIFGYRIAMVYSLLDLLVAICSIIALFLGISFISVVTSVQDYLRKRRRARELARGGQNK